MRYLLPFLFLGVTACHLPASQGPDVWGPDGGHHDWGHHAGTYASGYGPGGSAEPLRAAVWFDEFTGQAAFDLNRPAHVAVFAMQPLGGIEMIYPGWGWEGGVGRAFSSGRHRVRTESHMYHLTRSRSRYDRGRRSTGQTYILLIASDRPLELGQLRATGSIPWLDHASVTWNPFVATQHLAREIVPGHGGAEWTAAYHVVWPQDGLHRYDGRIPYTTVQCPGGAVISIPTEALRRGAWSCPDPDRPATPPTRPRAPQAPPVTEALPRRPRPTDWRGATPTTGGAAETPTARPVKRPRPVPDPEPTARARPPARPQASPRPIVRREPASRRPGVKPRATPRATPAPRPRPPSVKPKPKAKAEPKPKGGGGAG